MKQQTSPGMFWGAKPLRSLEADWMAGLKRPYFSPVVIGGCARSGTTLMRVILDSHSRICCGPETRLFLPVPIIIPHLAFQFEMAESVVKNIYRQSRSRNEFIETFANLYCEKNHCRIWVEKTAKNVRYIKYIFDAFPKARFINMVRDGRDVACSLRNHPKEQVLNGRIYECTNVHPIEECIDRWINDVDAARPYRHHPQFLTVRYEELVNRPERAIRSVIEFLDLPWEDSLLAHHEIRNSSRSPLRLLTNQAAADPIHKRSLGRWKIELSRREQILFKDKAGKLLMELGYEKTDEW